MNFEDEAGGIEEKEDASEVADKSVSGVVSEEKEKHGTIVTADEVKGESKIGDVDEVGEERKIEEVSSEENLRIMGGLHEEEGKSPYVVYLKVYNKQSDWIRNCGGSILNTTIILTSAGCVYE